MNENGASNDTTIKAGVANQPMNDPPVQRTPLALTYQPNNSAYNAALPKVSNYQRYQRTASLFNDIQLIPTDPSVDPPPRACFNCWKVGHSRFRCPQSRTRLYCYNCGRSGVEISQCPRCGEGYFRYVPRSARRSKPNEKPSERHEEIIATEENLDSSDEEVPISHTQSNFYQVRNVDDSQLSKRVRVTLKLLAEIKYLPVDTQVSILCAVYDIKYNEQAEKDKEPK